MRVEAKFKQRFGAPGEVPSDDVNRRLVGLEPFVAGYFHALATERHAAPVTPSVKSLQVYVSYDEKIDYTRIEINAVVNLDGDSSTWANLKGDLMVPMNAYLELQFPTQEPNDA